MDGGRVRHYSGNFDQYLARKASEKTEEKKKTGAEPAVEKKVKISYGDKKRFQELEETIPELEEEIERLDEELQAGGDDYGLLQEKHERIEELKADLEARYGEWTELAEKIEGNT